MSIVRRAPLIIPSIGFLCQILDHEELPQRYSELLHGGARVRGQDVSRARRILLRELRRQEQPPGVRSLPRRELVADREDPVRRYCVAGDHRRLRRERLAGLPGEDRSGNSVHLSVGGEAGREFSLQDGQQLALPCLKRESSRLWRKPEN